MTDDQILAEAKQKGFKNCLDVGEALGFNTRVTPWHAAYHQIEDAGFPVVFLLRDGDTDVEKQLYTGVYSDALDQIVVYRAAVTAERKYESWRDGAKRVQAMIDEYGPQTIYQDYEALLDSYGPEPPMPDEDVLQAAADRKGEIRERKQREANEKIQKRQELIQAVMNYAGPMNQKRGWPKRRALNKYLATLGFDPLDRRQRNTIWATVLSRKDSPGAQSGVLEDA